MLRQVQVGKIRPNPFRRLEEYPIDPEKVEALKSSIEHTGFWRTIIGRPVADGGVEVAFGHHRRVALLELFGPDESVELIVQDLSDDQMIQMMANENLSEYGADGWVEIETIRATIDAHCEGRISLPKMPKDTPPKHIRNVPQDSAERRYTATSVAQFLGWTKKNKKGIEPNFRCQVGFDALDAIRDGIVRPDQLKGLKRYKIHEIIREARGLEAEQRLAAAQKKKDARGAKKQATAARAPAEKARLEQRAAGHELDAQAHKADVNAKTRDFVDRATRIAKDKGRHQEIRNLARQMSAPTRQRRTPSPTVHARQLAAKLAKILSGKDRLSQQLDIVVEFRDQLTTPGARDLVTAATVVRDRLQKMIIDEFKDD